MSKNKNADWFFKGEPFQSDWALLLNERHPCPRPLLIDDGMSPCEIRLMDQANKSSKNDRPNENAI